MWINITYIHFQYINIFIFLIVSIILSMVILFLNYLLIKQYPSNEKLSAYECGFTPFEDSRTQFDIKFYLVSILFIIFDLEVSFLFPLINNITENDRLAYWIIIYFLFILVVGFIYEWMKGALDWQ